MRFITMMGTAALTMTAASQAQSILINEIRTGSANAEYIELKGTPGASLAGMSIVVIGDGTSTGTAITRTGVVEWLYHFGATDVIGKNGFLVLHNPGDATSGAFPFTVAAGATDLPWPLPVSGLATDTQIESPDNQTYFLVTGYSGTDTFVTRAPNAGAGGQDLDTNDDGTLEVTPWTSIVDNVVLKETNGSTPLAGQDWWYGTNFCGPFISRTLVQATSGTTIAGWDFQTTATGGTAAAAAPNTPKLFNANAGAGAMYLDGTNGSSDWLQATELNAFTGTALNATGTAAPGNGLDPATSLTSALALQGATANNKSAVLKFSMLNFQGVNLSYAVRTSGTVANAFNSNAWEWSTDGLTWTSAGASIPVTSSSFSIKSLPVLTALDGAADAYLRVTVSGPAVSASGNNRFDNLLLLSNAVTTDTVVTNYAGPVHGYRTSTGTWAIGTASATTAPMDTVGSENVDPATYACGDAGAGDCGTAHNNANCADSCCCAYVCTADPFCCDVRWDSICVTKASECAANCTAQPCPADFDADGTVGGADLGQLLGGWGGAELDLTADGIVNGADLGVLLGAWGACP